MSAILEVLLEICGELLTSLATSGRRTVRIGCALSLLVIVLGLLAWAIFG